MSETVHDLGALRALREVGRHESIAAAAPVLGVSQQALSARIFGFHSWSLALPQVIEGVVAVLVMYRVVRRWAGVTPGTRPDRSQSRSARSAAAAQADWAMVSRVSLPGAT